MLQRPGDAVRRGDQQQGQQRVRVVEPEHQHGGRGEREDGAGEQAGSRAGPAAHGGGEQGDGGDAFQRLRDQQAPGAEAEQPGGQAHHPQRGGRLVDGNEVGGVQRAEEPGLPAGRAGLYGGGVEAVRVARRREVPQVEQAGGGQQHEQGGPHPGGVARVAAPESGEPATRRRDRRGAAAVVGPRRAGRRRAGRRRAGRRIRRRQRGGGGHRGFL